MNPLAYLLVPLSLLLAGCAPAISPALQQEAIPQMGFAELAAHPENYQGRLVLLGGEVMSVQPWEKGSLMTVDQHDLNANNFPAAKASGGTFLVASDRWLSPEKYQPKSKVSVAGVVAGGKNGLLLLKAREIHFWEGPEWEKWYYPIPRDWYSPELEYWYTPPYWDPWRGSNRR
jgi:starvation-inducible outer membrane lipoprotein